MIQFSLVFLTVSMSLLHSRPTIYCNKVWKMQPQRHDMASPTRRNFYIQHHCNRTTFWWKTTKSWPVTWNWCWKVCVVCSEQMCSSCETSIFDYVFRLDTADVVTNKLKEESKAVYLTQLATFVELLPHIKRDLNRMKDITNGLRANASQLSDGLRSVKRELLQSLSKCQMEMCKKVLKEYEIGKLDVNGIDYDQVTVNGFVHQHKQQKTKKIISFSHQTQSHTKHYVRSTPNHTQKYSKKKQTKSQFHSIFHSSKDVRSILSKGMFSLSLCHVPFSILIRLRSLFSVYFFLFVFVMQFSIFSIDFSFRCIFIFCCESLPFSLFTWPIFIGAFFFWSQLIACTSVFNHYFIFCRLKMLIFLHSQNKAREKKTIIFIVCSQLPDVSSLIGNVDDLISEEDIKTISQSQQRLENIRKDINHTIHSKIPEVTESIRRTGGAIKNISHVIDRTFGQISDSAGSMNNHFNTADAYIKEYYIYVYYALLGISATLLLVLMCIVCGLLCGICGKRPDGYGDDCCNKGAGARFLIL